MFQPLTIFVPSSGLAPVCQSLLYWADYLWTLFSRSGFTSATERGIITFLHLLATLLLMQVLRGWPPSSAGRTGMKQSTLTSMYQIMVVDNIGYFLSSAHAEQGAFSGR